MTLQEQLAEEPDKAKQQEEAIAKVRAILEEADFDLTVLVVSTLGGTTILALPHLDPPELSGVFRFMAGSIDATRGPSEEAAVH